MKIKLAENLPRELVGVLAALGHSADTVPDEGLAGRDDGAVLAAAESESRLLITQDLDFADLRRMTAKEGIMIVRLIGCSRQRLLERVSAVVQGSDLSACRGCLVIVTAHKVRVRKMGGV